MVAGCNYSVTKEKGLTYNYDLEIIAREVRERFVRGRSKLLPMVGQMMMFLDIPVSQRTFVNRVCVTLYSQCPYE